MNAKGEVCLGVAGAGRATELHMNALKRFGGVPVCYKHIMARRFEQVQVMKDRYGFINASLNFDDLLNDPEIDVIDICTPPYVHEDMVERAMRAGKHVICEKPLSGYFGAEGDEEPIGTKVSKVVMYDRVLENLERVRKTVESSDTMFMYAENFVYAPAVVKAAEIIQKKKSRILFKRRRELKRFQFSCSWRMEQNRWWYIYPYRCASADCNTVAEIRGSTDPRGRNKGCERLCGYGNDNKSAH